ncbi:MAG: hypothetical protein QOI31_1895, partial [Solirubrobacterales bacterium]|nr:hypothetical protein [Solirubrobacterales bacterium]
MSTLPTRSAPLVAGPGSADRPGVVHKTTGEFAFSSDLWIDDMLWGATLRSPHPRARIVSIDTSAALRLPGVRAVLTHDDVPGRKTFGLGIPHQPVLAFDEVRCVGEAVAVVAAEKPHLAREALQHISVEYEVLPPVTDPEFALTPE